MHGPTFMANPLACAVAVAIRRTAALPGLARRGRRDSTPACEPGWHRLASCPGSSTSGCSARSASSSSPEPVDMRAATDAAVGAGVWLRPFRNLIYAMPPYICTADDVARISAGMVAAAPAVGTEPDAGRRTGTRTRLLERCSSMVPTVTASAALAWLDDRRAALGAARACAATLRSAHAVGADLDLASNDYLGLVRHPEVIDGAAAALRRWGGGATGSRLVTGTTADTNCSNVNWPSSSAPRRVWCSPAATPPTSVRSRRSSGRDALVVSDAGCHASLVDACRLSRARVVRGPAQRRRRGRPPPWPRAPRTRAARAHRLGVQRRRRSRTAARIARGVPRARRDAARRRGARSRCARGRRPRTGPRGGPGRRAGRGRHRDAVEVAGSQGGVVLADAACATT